MSNVGDEVTPRVNFVPITAATVSNVLTSALFTMGGTDPVQFDTATPVDFTNAEESPCGALTIEEVAMRSNPSLSDITLGIDGSIDIGTGAIPDYAVALEVDFKLVFSEANEFSAIKDTVYTAKFTIGNIEWDLENWTGMEIYALGDKEYNFSLPKLLNPTPY